MALLNRDGRCSALLGVLLAICIVPCRVVVAYSFPKDDNGKSLPEYQRLADAIKAGDLELAKAADDELNKFSIHGLDRYLLQVSTMKNRHVVRYFVGKYKLLISDFVLGVAAGDLEAVRQLLVEDDDTTSFELRSGTPMVMAVHRRNIDMVKLLLEFGASPDKGYDNYPPYRYDYLRTPLHGAIRLADFEMVKVLLGAGAKANLRGYSISGPPNVFYQGESVRDLVWRTSWSTGDPIESRKHFWAKREKLLDFLVDEGLAKIHSDPEMAVAPPLRSAIETGRLEMVRILLEAGADPKVPFGESSTALIEAVRLGHPGIVKLLIDAGVDVNQVDGQGRTPLQEAYYKGDIKDLLIAAGAKHQPPKKQGAAGTQQAEPAKPDPESDPTVDIFRTP